MNSNPWLHVPTPVLKNTTRVGKHSSSNILPRAVFALQTVITYLQLSLFQKLTNDVTMLGQWLPQTECEHNSWQPPITTCIQHTTWLCGTQFLQQNWHDKLIFPNQNAPRLCKVHCSQHSVWHVWMVDVPWDFRTPAVHQQRVFSTLRDLIGKICHVYLDDIIIWSDSLAEHETNIKWYVLEALHIANLYCSFKKTCLEVNLLGHHISKWGIEPDPEKIEWIVNCPRPKHYVFRNIFLYHLIYTAGITL